MQSNENPKTLEASPVPVDDNLAKQMHDLASEASERSTFHSFELERWTRVGRAAQRALAELHQQQPVAQHTPDGFLDSEAEHVGHRRG